ncbi:Fc.00g028880.m01.CDS01 [Cosmosporella sp. VM-42]
MPPAIIIADSDDEESDYSPPPSPQAPGPAATRSSDHSSHATSSTDPAFFQNIYDEQSDAAREFVPEPPSRDRPSSSEVTAPAPFERTRTGLVDASSLTSVTDPATAKDHKSSSGKGMSDWTEVSTPGRKKALSMMKAPVAKMDDPWDVPSSPEDNRARPVTLKVRSKGEEVKPTSGPTLKKKTVIKLHTKSRVSKEAPHVENAAEEDGSPVGRRKRRKIEYSQTSQQGSNDVDLVMIPFSNDKGITAPAPQKATTSTMLPPTLPVDNSTSFYVATNPLTNSQKMQYHSVHLASSDNNHEMPPTLPPPLPPMYNIDAHMHESSGSATNTNTPRSDMPYHSTGPQPSDAAMSVQSKTGRSPYPPQNSSPDVISLIESPEKREEITREEEPRREPSIEACNDELSEAHVAEAPQDDLQAKGEVLEAQQGLSNDPQGNDEDLDYAQKPIKTKKPRGRPKKKASGDPGDAEPEPRQKKKRGRPRKSDQLAAVEKSAQVETELPEDTAYVEKQGAKVDVESGTRCVMDKTSCEEREPEQHEPEGPPAEIEVEARAIPAAGTGNQRGHTKLKKPNQNAAIPPSPGRTETVLPIEPGQSETVRQEMTAGGAKRSTDSKGLAAIAAATNKPLYRVGLSKRSRIAPLLKSLRK